MAMAYINDESVEDTRVIGNGYIEYKPFSWLSWRTEIGADIYNSFSNIRKGDLPDNLTGVVGNQATESTTLNYKTVVNNLLNVNKMFGHDHSSKVSLVRVTNIPRSASHLWQAITFQS